MEVRPGSREQGRRAWLVAALVGGVAACGGLFVATYLLAVHTTRGRLLDGAALRGAVSNGSRVTDDIELLLNAVSVTTLVAAAGFIAVVALLRGRRELAVACTVLVLGANVTSQVLKRYALERPQFGFYESTPSTLNSLPSGHSTVAFSLAVAAVLVLPFRLRSTVAWLGAAYGTATAVATLSAGWHRPSDSVAAFLVVGAWATGTAAVLVARHGSHGRVPVDRHRDTPRHLGLLAAYLLAFAAILAFVVLTTALDTYGTAAQVLAYLAGAAAIAGTATAAMAGVLVLAPLLVDE